MWHENKAPAGNPNSHPHAFTMHQLFSCCFEEAPRSRPLTEDFIDLRLQRDKSPSWCEALQQATGWQLEQEAERPHLQLQTQRSRGQTVSGAGLPALTAHLQGPTSSSKAPPPKGSASQTFHNLPKQRQQPVPTCSNTQSFGGHFLFKPPPTASSFLTLPTDPSFSLLWNLASDRAAYSVRTHLLRGFGLSLHLAPSILYTFR